MPNSSATHGADTRASHRRPVPSWRQRLIDRTTGWTAWPIYDRPSQIFLLLAAGYVAARLSVHARFTVFTSFDTSSYATRPGAGEQVGTLSFAGHAPRPWGVPLLYSVMGSDAARAHAQLLIGTLAWLTVACALWLHLRSLVSRIPAVVAVFLLALTPTVYTWDYAILSESLSVNLGLLSFGLFAVWMKSGSTLTLTLMTLTGFWWAFTRQDVLGFVAVLVLALMVAAWRGRQQQPHRAAAAVAAAVLVCAIGYHSAIVPAIDKGYQSWGSGHRLAEATFIYRLRFGILPDQRVTRFYETRLGMPRCEAATRVARQPWWAMRPFIRAYHSCPELSAWQDAHAATAGYLYALGDPAHYLSTLVDSTMPVALAGQPRADYARPVALLPDRLGHALFPAPDLVLPIQLGLIGAALIAGIWAGAWRRRRWMMLSGVSLAAVSLTNIAATLMYTAGEYGRFGIQESIFLRLSAVIVVTATVDAALTSTDEAARGTTPGRPSEIRSASR